jgi:sugar phosphate isomerase/epimerase
MALPRVGVQLIVFGEATQTDLLGTLKACAAAGYAGFEMGVPSDDQDLARWQAARDAAGIVCTGCHSGTDQLADPAGVKALLKYAKAMGAEYLLVSGGSYDTVDGYVEAAKLLNRAGAECRAAGVKLCYHNHYWEFKSIGGQVPFHTMIAALDPAAAKLCPDVYWVSVGGEAPAEFISCYQDRVPYFHFKDGLGGEQFREFRELGRGTTDLPAALKAALATNPDWIVAEQDSSSLPPAESVRISREYLRSLGL